MHVLIAGESWVTHATHVKGVDSFTLSSYVEGVGPLRDALLDGGHEVTHLPAHLVPDEFPAPPTRSRHSTSWCSATSARTRSCCHAR